MKQNSRKKHKVPKLKFLRNFKFLKFLTAEGLTSTSTPKGTPKGTPEVPKGTSTPLRGETPKGTPEVPKGTSTPLVSETSNFASLVNVPFSGRVMKGKSFNDISEKNFKLLPKEVYISEKLDGVRCI